MHTADGMSLEGVMQQMEMKARDEGALSSAQPPFRWATLTLTWEK